MSQPLYKAGQGYRGDVLTRDSDGVSTAADSTPTAVMYRNGVPDGSAAVTVAQVSGGLYTLTATIPGGYAAGDVVTVKVAATVGGLTTEDLDTFRLVAVDAADAAAFGLGRLDAAVGSRLATSGYTAPPSAAAVATQVETQILDEGDSRAVLQALVDKINAADPDLSGLTLSAIAQAVRDVGGLDAAPAGSLGDRVNLLYAIFPEDALARFLTLPAAGTIAVAGDLAALFDAPRLARIDGAQQVGAAVTLPTPAPAGYGAVVRNVTVTVRSIEVTDD